MVGFFRFVGFIIFIEFFVFEGFVLFDGLVILVRFVLMFGVVIYWLDLLFLEIYYNVWFMSIIIVKILENILKNDINCFYYIIV